MPVFDITGIMACHFRLTKQLVLSVTVIHVVITYSIYHISGSVQFFFYEQPLTSEFKCSTDAWEEFDRLNPGNMRWVR